MEKNPGKVQPKKLNPREYEELKLKELKMMRESLQKIEKYTGWLVFYFTVGIAFNVLYSLFNVVWG